MLCAHGLSALHVRSTSSFLVVVCVCVCMCVCVCVCVCVCAVYYKQRTDNPGICTNVTIQAGRKSFSVSRQSFYDKQGLNCGVRTIATTFNCIFLQTLLHPQHCEIWSLNCTTHKYFNTVHVIIFLEYVTLLHDGLSKRPKHVAINYITKYHQTQVSMTLLASHITVCTSQRYLPRREQNVKFTIQPSK